MESSKNNSSSNESSEKNSNKDLMLKTIKEQHSEMSSGFNIDRRK